ncbi:MAG: PTS fructose transporter subunit IIA [Deltaproteobacteria bacterium RIFCSPLOWO2_01_44_7]|nr:MAG: PTS fructose transporter subunit IIA [Deltaproteobacteria bacterium RIFCSPHIGHO2_01_FULL_43_49]OGQ16298.1 MAG: PTS fructose transporter subunit IIA [Deltaproteobacteria bacterium RIFCSPHIGHO2_02_FULL_44_53]OGQ29258.1 MAG: PTS fructose transporter subunit IIA [Deltaproteobacteria bacterium RIFCSPHIGHO2_12_FULL_44_21]OGQ32815.1 MAG: PTS fructose transporter subunit IIA [Deltaproteobacteria bacterium RIFCSPLOWO2_01_FULL_45_74]OGQ38727.1 MAG: PTS fructose transporter subunit IIA [Deltaprote
MKIADSLSKELILPNLGAKNKVDCLMEFAQAVAKKLPELKKDEIAHTLLEREKLGSTGIQDGIAIPHGKIKTLSNILILFGRSLEGIDFQAHDNKPTQLFFVLLAPENATSIHLKLLARLSRLLKNLSLRERLLQAKDAQAIYQILCEEDEKL